MKSFARRSALVHVDAKTPELSTTLLEAFRKADMVDHIIGYNATNSQAFQQAKIPEIPFKGSILGTRQDFDPEYVKRIMERPGQVVFLDDPRATLGVLGRKAQSARSPGRFDRVFFPRIPPKLEAERAVLQGRSSEFPVRVAAARIARHNRNLLVRLLPELARSRKVEIRRALAWNLAMNPGIVSWYGRARAHYEPIFLNLLADSDPTVRVETAIACGGAHVKGAGPDIVRLLDKNLGMTPKDAAARGVLIDARGHFAFALGLLGERDPETVAVLLKTFRQREKGNNRMWLGVDGAMSAWALGKLRVAEAVPLFREALLWQPPPGVDAADDDEPPRAFVYWDLQAPRFLPKALVEIGTPEAFAVLDEVLRLPAAQVGRRSPELLLHTAEALAQVATGQRLDRLAQLFSQGSSQARGTAVLQCLREPGAEYRRLLESHAAWAVPWWDVEHGGRP